MCDLEVMFYQFKVKEEDCDYLRFYWWENGDIMKILVQYCMIVYLFGVVFFFGCLNFGFKKIVIDNECEFGFDVVEFIKKDFYVDDGFKLVVIVFEVMLLIENIKSICVRGGMCFYKFIFNFKEVIVKIVFDD